MADHTFTVFEATNLGGSLGFVTAGSITVRETNGIDDDIFNDGDSAGGPEIEDQLLLASTVPVLDASDGDEYIRTRSLWRMTNDDTGETFDVHEIWSESLHNSGVANHDTYFIFSSPPPDWVFDSTTNRSFSFFQDDGTLTYASITCFGADTLITQAGGRDVVIEDMKVGDRVLTQGGAAHPVRWIGSRKITPCGLIANPKLRPIRIKAGALGCGRPTQDLLVSRQHRVLARSVVAQRIFGTVEVLIPAIKLIGLEGIEIAHDVVEIEYFHILFDHHRVIFSNGAPTESLFTGPQAMKTVSHKARAEITTLFPEIVEPGFHPISAALFPEKPKDIKHLVARLLKNGKPVLERL